VEATEAGLGGFFKALIEKLFGIEEPLLDRLAAERNGYVKDENGNIIYKEEGSKKYPIYDETFIKTLMAEWAAKKKDGTITDEEENELYRLEGLRALNNINLGEGAYTDSVNTVLQARSDSIKQAKEEAATPPDEDEIKRLLREAGVE